MTTTGLEGMDHIQQLIRLAVTERAWAVEVGPVDLDFLRRFTIARPGFARQVAPRITGVEIVLDSTLEPGTFRLVSHSFTRPADPRDPETYVITRVNVTMEDLPK